MNMLFDRRVKILCIILVFLPWTYYINNAKRHNNLYRPRLLNVLEIPATAENQNPFNYLFCTRLGALSGDVPILSAVVARFITRWLGAVGGNVAGFSAIETTAVRVLLLHNGTLFVLVSCFVGAITGNVSLLATMVARLGTTVMVRATSSASSSAPASSTTPSTTSGFYSFEFRHDVVVYVVVSAAYVWYRS